MKQDPWTVAKMIDNQITAHVDLYHGGKSSPESASKVQAASHVASKPNGAPKPLKQPDKVDNETKTDI